MNKQIIIQYYLRDIPERHRAFQVLEHTDGVQTIDFYFCAPQYDKPLPSDGDLLSMEPDALAWYETQRIMTYDQLFKLIPRIIRAQIQLFKFTLIESEDAQARVSGYMLSELERDITTGEIYNDGDASQRAEFDDIRDLFVSGGVLSQEQANRWGALEAVE